MSTTDDSWYSVAQQRAMISSDLNSTLLFQFLFGIYTGLFPVTIYLYIHKENRTRTRDTIIIGTITALYFLTALNSQVNWFYTTMLFGRYGATRVKISIESVNQSVPLGEDILGDLINFVIFVFADGFLVWRCFHACGRSFRRILLPMALLIAETALALTITVYDCLISAKANFETNQTEEIFNILSSATLVAAAATSVFTTSVICLQIWRQITLSSQPRNHYRTIINALIQSSAIYTVAVLSLAIVNFIPAGEIENWTVGVVLASYFVEAVTNIVTGLAPTLMIAQLTVSSSREDAEVSSGHLSFERTSRAASRATGANMTYMGADLEMQQMRSIGVDGDVSEEIQAVPRNGHHGQPEDEIEDIL